ncbi:MAG: branched-chain amino acid ABC transporter permease [Rhodospirillaceae bacterium]|nr:branched-chain amino acid ABC transporter permease [Rhodospirillaceae bacterium]|tara:strand:- start:183 stop:1085 length:903 start_codon:yes stop_codon:yes gene_type:complete
MFDPIFIIENSISGLFSGGIYALIGLGIVFIFRATKVFNFAHGAVIMFGAYFYFTFSDFASSFGLSIWLVFLISLPLTFISSAVLGVLIEKFLMRPMMGQHPFPLIMITIGLISVLEGLAAMIWTPAAQYPKPLFPLNIDFIGSLAINRQMFFSFLLALLIFLIISILFVRSKNGVAIRATATDQSTAALMGINVSRVFAISWIIACVTGSLAGILLAPLNSLTPSLGIVGLSVISVVILGGLDSIIGVLIAAFIIGWVEAMASHFLGGQYKEIVPYVVVLLIIIIKPYGLMGSEQIDRL